MHKYYLNRKGNLKLFPKDLSTSLVDLDKFWADRTGVGPYPSPSSGGQVRFSYCSLSYLTYALGLATVGGVGMGGWGSSELSKGG